MRKFFFCLILAIGAGLGFILAIVSGWGWGAGLITMAFSVVVTAPFAGLLTGIGRRHRARRRSNWRGAGFSGTTGSVSDGVVRSHRWDR